MFAAVLYFLIVSAGGVFAAACTKRRFEEAAPAATLAVLLLVYLFGWLDCLPAGIYAACGLALALYAAAGVTVARKKNGAAFLRRLLTPGFALYALYFAVLLFADNGRLVCNRDDFTHWGDTVKIMFLTGRFGATPASHALDQTYPPGQAGLQYLLQALQRLFTGGETVTEWLLFPPVQLFAVALLLPMLRTLDWKRSGWRIPVLWLAVIGLPGALLNPVYRTLEADAALGLLSGLLLAYLILGKFGRLEAATFFLGTAGLSLIKQVGVGYAGFLTLAALLYAILQLRRDGDRRALWIPALGAGGTAIAWGSWKFYTTIHQSVQDFPLRIDWQELFGIVFRGETGGYRRGTLLHFLRSLVTDPLSDSGIWPFPPSDLVALLVLIGVAVLLYRMQKRSDHAMRRTGGLWMFAFLGVGAFTAGTALTYLYVMAQWEAEVLMCSGRYVATPLLMVLTAEAMAAVPLLHAMGKGSCRRALTAVFLVLLLILLPYKDLGNLALRRNVTYSIGVRERTRETVETVEQLALPAETRISVVTAQSDPDFDLALNALRFSLRPLWVDLYRKAPNRLDPAVCSAAQWRRTLWEEGYDYVILSTADDAFCAAYAEAFADPSAIRTGGVYRFDAGTRLLASAD